MTFFKPVSRWTKRRRTDNEFRELVTQLQAHNSDNAIELLVVAENDKRLAQVSHGDNSQQERDFSDVDEFDSDQQLNLVNVAGIDLPNPNCFAI